MKYNVYKTILEVHKCENCEGSGNADYGEYIPTYSNGDCVSCNGFGMYKNRDVIYLIEHLIAAWKLRHIL